MSFHQANLHLKCYIYCHLQYWKCFSTTVLSIKIVKNCNFIIAKSLKTWCFLSFKAIFFAHFLQTDTKHAANCPVECCAKLSNFCTEQLLKGLTNTAKWNAINLAHSTIAACLFCKGRWVYIKVDWGFRVFFFAKWMPQIIYWHTADELIIILFCNLRPPILFSLILYLISRPKFLPSKFFSKVLNVFWDVISDGAERVTLCHNTTHCNSDHYRSLSFIVFLKPIGLSGEPLELNACHI